MILTREQVDGFLPVGDLIERCEDEFGPWNDGDPSPLRDLRETARAYHDLRDAVLALHYYGGSDYIIGCAECGDDWPCATVRAIESVGAR